MTKSGREERLSYHGRVKRQTHYLPNMPLHSGDVALGYGHLKRNRRFGVRRSPKILIRPAEERTSDEEILDERLSS